MRLLRRTLCWKPLGTPLSDQRPQVCVCIRPPNSPFYVLILTQCYRQFTQNEILSQYRFRGCLLEYLLIVVVILLIVASLFSILPSARQRQQLKMRQAARLAGVSVDLMTIDDPNPNQDKYISHIGHAIPARLKVVAYRIKRIRRPEWHLLPDIQWRMERQLDGDWLWVSKKPHLSRELKNFLDDAKRSLPGDVLKVEESSSNIILYWHERTAGSEDNILNFLKKCAELPPYDLSSEKI